MTVRIGMIGPGAMGRSHIERIRRRIAGAEVVAVSDLDDEHARTVAMQIGAAAYPTSAELIAAADVDAVMICSHGPAHRDDVVAAVDAGKPVFCEKPLAPTASECLDIMDAEQRAGRRLVTVGFMRRFDPGYVQMKDILTSGEIGEPLIFHSAHRNPAVPLQYTPDMAINDTAIHDIDIVRWLLAEEVTTVRVDTPRATRHRPGRLQDPLILILSTTSGVWVDVEIFVNNQHAYDVQGELVAETGTVRLTDQQVVERSGTAGRGHRLAMDHNERFAAAFDAELQQWVAAVAHGECTGPSSWDGYAAASVCDAAVRAIHAEAATSVSMIERPALYR
ncbi:Gfo/Idh/MocA family protein [Rudaeicoccus suwonensis]|uniref:Inositol 2-dehydrogenase n=1 Tax=Rudaeicoccus suwonensis TaxID=657409 RepID=A0A561EBF2_9MICO|nr:Gfo/Idh/MocA family oxidoreductase [Rudaeicoccus suwonensis]TWE12917.1 myo-inositol 2-dehydrogenase [Rudaeicoccus suwonensis]